MVNQKYAILSLFPFFVQYYDQNGMLQQAETGDYKGVYSYGENWMKLERFSGGRYLGYHITYFNLDELKSESYIYNSNNELRHKNKNFYSENLNPYFSTLMPMYKLETLVDHLLKKVEIYTVRDGIEDKRHVREHKYIDISDLPENQVVVEQTLTYYEDNNEIRKIETDTLVFEYVCN